MRKPFPAYCSCLNISPLGRDSGNDSRSNRGSPYYRINYSSEKSPTIVVNLLGHQTMIGKKKEEKKNDPFSGIRRFPLSPEPGFRPTRGFNDILIIRCRNPEETT